MPATVPELVDLLTLEPLDERVFRGRQPENSLMPRVFGGQVAAQALVAAQNTVPEERRVHSLHSYFILGGDPSIPILYDVEDVRDGGSFTTRRVAARQHGAIIFYMTASFQKLEEGYDHQDAMPEVVSPDECPTIADLLRDHSPEAAEFWDQEWAAADVRRTPTSDPTTQRMWFRLNGEIDDVRTLRTALLTYYSDLTLLGPTLRPHGLNVSSPHVQVASLDHTIWFHRSADANQWFLYDQHSPSASHGRGLSIARVFTESGELVASIAQEGLIRPVSAR
ncbi:MAG TPA: acyl-CoA thioesterase II [Aeromicrobium sp.]|nr:acyl-CoA thioesterase II [Aeromicrobium sp.]